MFQTHTCQFEMGLLQGAQQNVLWLQIQVRDIPFMQELQGTSWGIRPTLRNRSEKAIPHLPLTTPPAPLPALYLPLQACPTGLLHWLLYQMF